MDAAKKRLEGIEALSNIGERASVDTIEAAIFYQTRLLDLQNAEIDNLKSTNELSTFLWQNNEPSLPTKKYEALDSLDSYYTKAKTSLAEIFNLLNIQNPILSKYGALQNVLDVEVRLKKEMIKPILNVKYNIIKIRTNVKGTTIISLFFAF